MNASFLKCCIHAYIQRNCTKFWSSSNSPFITSSRMWHLPEGLIYFKKCVGRSLEMNLLFCFSYYFLLFFPKYNIIFYFCFQQEYKNFRFFGIISPVRHFKKPFNTLKHFRRSFLTIFLIKKDGDRERGLQKRTFFRPPSIPLHTHTYTLSLPPLLYSCLTILFITNFLTPNFSNFWSVPLRHFLDQFIGVFRCSCFCKRIIVEDTFQQY